MGGQGGNSLTETADIKKTRWTLQVQAVLCPCRKTGTSALPGHPERDFAASLALEASLALSLFIFTVILIAIPIDMLDTQRRIQMTIEAAAREAAQAAVLLRKDAAPSEDQEQKAGLGRELLTSAGVQVYLLKKAQDAGAPKIEGLSVSGSGIRENGDEVDFRAEYRIRLPFRVFTLSAVPFSARSRKHGWTGSDKEDGRIRQFTSVGTAPDITVRHPATIFPMRFTGYPPGVFRGSGMRAAAATGPAGSAEERMHRNILCCRRGRPTTRRRTARRCPIMCGRFRCRRWSIWAPVPTAEEARKG